MKMLGTWELMVYYMIVTDFREDEERKKETKRKYIYRYNGDYHR